MKTSSSESLRGRKILVAGGTGLVGANLVQRLNAEGAEVTASYHNRPPTFLHELFRPADFSITQAAHDFVQGVDDVIICAAHTGGIEAMRKNPAASVVPNVAIVANLLEASQVHGVKRVVALSSSTVYQEANHPIRECELDLNQPPHEAYLAIGNVNRFLEQLCRFYHRRFGLPIGLLRPSSIYGPHDHFEPGRSHVLPALIRRALAKENPLKVWGRPDVVRDFVFVDDVVQAILDVLEGYCTCDPVNVGAGRPVTVGEAASLILKLCRQKTSVEFDASQPTAIPYRALNIDKWDVLFRNRERTNLRDGLAKTIAWARLSDQSRP